MASNFFTNQGENTLYKKFVGVFEHMQNIEYFKSVIGYFRASGYFAIRKHFPDDLKVKIIAGINVDPLNLTADGTQLATISTSTLRDQFDNKVEDLSLIHI